MRGLPAPRILLPVVVVETGLLDVLVTARALDEVVAALDAGPSVFLIRRAISARCVAPALRACGGFFCHKAKVTESEKKSRKKFDKSRPSHYDPTLTSLSLFRRSTLLENEPLVLSKIVPMWDNQLAGTRLSVGWFMSLFLLHVYILPHIWKNARDFSKNYFLFFIFSS